MDLFNISIWFVVKLFFLLALVIYLVFASVVVRQVYLMLSTLKVGFDFPIKTIAWLHLLFAIVVFLVALVTL